MARISSFKIATWMFGIAALVKMSALALALAMLGIVDCQLPSRSIAKNEAAETVDSC